MFSAQEIVDAIKKCEGLKSFCMQGNTLGLEAAKVIADALKTKSTLKVLFMKLSNFLLKLRIAFIFTLKIKELDDFRNLIILILILNFHFQKDALWSDMYTGRLRSEIPPSLVSDTFMITIFVTNPPALTIFICECVLILNIV